MENTLPIQQNDTLYTIGHSNLNAEDFLDLLRKHNIIVLVDVRSKPYSRLFPHFGKDALQVFLTQHNVEYRFAGEYLGGQPKDSTVYADDQQPNEDTERADFLEIVRYDEVAKRDWFRKGIKHLLTIVSETTIGSVAIMCSESHPFECHRHHLIARSLIDPAWRWIEPPPRVVHIIKGGALQVVDESMFVDSARQLSLF